MTAEKRTFNPTKRLRREVPRYFSCSMVRYFTEQSVYVHMSLSNEIITQCCLASESYEFHKSWGSSDLILQPVITCVCLCGEFMHPVPYAYRYSFSNRTETELKCNTGFSGHITLSCYHIQIDGL
jgi:hypothetical protein